ncbi:MAG: PilT/PilU family type 4a pilus ATPase [Candidatus Margulisiibacteriota bacterium]
MDISSYLKELNKALGSDLLLVAGSPACLRVGNSLVKIGSPLSPEQIEALLIPIISKESMAEFKKVLELDVSYEDDMARYRINLHFQRGSIAATMRLVQRNIPTLEELGLPPIVKSFTNFERGLVLITGPTGSGKSTTQASMIDLINASRACHIITIEDPIEYMHTPKQAIIEQREVGIDTLSFGEGLKRVLRQIPDVILVGEIRDLESIQMAITAAETGHLVITTLHTPDAVQAVDRIIDVFPPHQQNQVRTQLSLTLQGIVAQQLIPRKEGKGLALAAEVVVNTPAIRNIIRKGATQDLYSMVELGKQQGMISMEESLKELVNKGSISKEQALTYAINRDKLEKLLGLQ